MKTPNETTRAKRRALQARRRRSGFTLLELMVALAIGTLVVATMYTLGGASARAFQEQQRITQLQLATRLAFDRVRRDVALAGFGGLTNPGNERTCGGLPIPQALVGIQAFEADPEGAAALATMPGRPPTDTDRLRIVGNLTTSDSYLIANTGNAAGTQIRLQSSWQGFRRSFATDAAGTTFDSELFQNDVFAPGRLVHIVHPQGFHFVASIVNSSLDAAGRSPQINLSTGLPSTSGGQCNFALCVGCTVSPLTAVDYLITTPTAAYAPRDAAVTGANSVLVRRVVNPLTGATISERVILEYAVELSASLAIDTAPVGQPANIQWQAGGTAITQPGRIRAARISLSGRSPEIDPAFQGPARSVTGMLTSFTPFDPASRIGASRVRTAMADIVLPNFAARGM